MSLPATGLAPEVKTSAQPADQINLGEVTLSRADHDRLATFLSEEIARAEAETEDFRNKVILYRDFVDPTPQTLSFPWPGAANYFIPIPRTIVDAFKSSFKQSVTKQKQLFEAEILSPEDAGIPEGSVFDTQRAFADVCEDLATDPNGMDIHTFLDNWLEEQLIAGIGPCKLVLEPQEKKVWARRHDETAATQRTIQMRSGPRLYSVPIGTWVWPAGLWSSVQAMPWVGNWIEMGGSALQQRAGAPWNYNKEAVEVIVNAGGESPGANADFDNRMQKVGQAPMRPTNRIYEMYLDWDLKGDNQLHSVCVSLHPVTRRILRIAYGDGWKPFDYGVFSTRAGTIFGRGVIEGIIQLCRAINTAVNNTFNSQTLANTPSLIYPEDSKIKEILASNGGFFPGIPLPYKEEKAEVGILEFPPPSDASFRMIGFFLQQIERITRIGPSRLGEISEGRRTPATLGLATQQLGAEMIDELIDRGRLVLARLMSRYLMLAYQNDKSLFIRKLGKERGALVTAVVHKACTDNRPLNELIDVRLSASSGTRSIELERQNALATAQMSMQWFQQVMGLVQAFQVTPDPTVRDVMIRILSASEEQMIRLAELANQPDIQAIIPEISEQLQVMQQQMIQQQQMMQQAQAVGLAPPGMAGPGGPPAPSGPSQGGGGEGGKPQQPPQ